MSSGSWQALGKRQRAESDSGFGYLFPDIPAILIEKERGAESPANTDRTENKGDGKRAAGTDEADGTWRQAQADGKINPHRNSGRGEPAQEPGRRNRFLSE